MDVWEVVAACFFIAILPAFIGMVAEEKKPKRPNIDNKRRIRAACVPVCNHSMNLVTGDGKIVCMLCGEELLLPPRVRPINHQRSLLRCTHVEGYEKDKEGRKICRICQLPKD